MSIQTIGISYAIRFSSHVWNGRLQLSFWIIVFENSVSVIEAGKSTAAQPAVLKFLTDAFVDSTPYLLPVSIVSLSDSALAVNDNLKTLYFSVSCVAGTLYISSNPLTDYTFSNTENW